MSDVDRFRIENPTFEYGYKMVVMAADHDRVVASIKHQHDIVEQQLRRELDRERARVAELEKAVERARTKTLGVVRVVK